MISIKKQIVKVRKYAALSVVCFAFACTPNSKPVSTDLISEELSPMITETLIEQTESRFFETEDKSWKSERQSKKLGQLNYSASVMPKEYYLLRSIDATSTDELNSIMESLQGEQVIEFEIEHDSERELFQEDLLNPTIGKPIEYLASTIQKDFTAVSLRGDSINCSGVLFERNFKLAPFKRVLLFFSGISENEPMTLIYKDQLFQKGELQFSFNTQPIQISNPAI